VGLALFLLFSGFAYGQANTMQGPRAVVTSASTGSVVGDFNRLIQTRTYTPTTGGSTVFDDLLKKPWIPRDISNISCTVSPGSACIPDPKTRGTIPWASAARGAARMAPYIGTAILIKDLWDYLGCREKFGGGIECKGFEEEQLQWCWRHELAGPGFNNSSDCFPTEAGATIAGYDRFVLQRNGTVWQDGCWGVTYNVTGRSGRVVTYTSQSVNKCGSTTIYPIGTLTTTLSINRHNQVLQCEEGSSKRYDGKCWAIPTVWEVVTEDQMTTKVDSYGDKTKATEYVKEIDKANVPMNEPAPRQIIIPTSVDFGRTSTTNPDGSTTVTDQGITWRVIPIAPGSPPKFAPDFAWEETTRTNTYPPGVTPPPLGTPPGTAQPPGTVPGGSTSSTPTEFKGCGLPNTPACKIDESGTPTADTATQSQVDGIFAALKACVLTPSTCLPALPALSWAFTLPTGCSAIPLGAYSTVGFPSYDICQWQGVIHSLMGMLWAAAGLFGAIRIVGMAKASG
jgi:hypothetical protein